MMNNEDIERKMNFIVEQQAQFASDIQQLELAQARTEKVVGHTVQAVAQMEEVVTRLAKVTHAGFTDVNAKINALIDDQLRTEANLARTEANVARTEANVARTEANVASTDERLRDLISLFDRHIRQGKNGK